MKRRLQTALQTTNAIRGLGAPTNLTELRYFVGLSNVFSRFVKNFAKLLAPLNEKLRNDQLAKFGSVSVEETQWMKALKQTLMSATLLILTNTTGDMALNTGSCTVPVGRVLLQQRVVGTTDPIGYWSRSLTGLERKIWYDTTSLPSLYGCTFITLISRRNQTHHKDRSRITEVDPESHRNYRQTHKLWFATIQIIVRRSSQNTHQARGRRHVLTVAHQWGRQRITRRWSLAVCNSHYVKSFSHTHLCDRHY